MKTLRILVFSFFLASFAVAQDYFPSPDDRAKMTVDQIELSEDILFCYEQFLLRERELANARLTNDYRYRRQLSSYIRRVNILIRRYKDRYGVGFDVNNVYKKWAHKSIFKDVWEYDDNRPYFRYLTD